MRLRTLLPAILILVAGGCADAPQMASPASPVARGEAMARRLCAGCHAIGASDRSRHAGAPPFRALSESYPVSDLAEALVEGLMTGHPDMPEYQFSPEAADDFIAYLESIQKDGAAREDDRDGAEPGA